MKLKLLLSMFLVLSILLTSTLLNAGTVASNYNSKSTWADFSLGPTMCVSAPTWGCSYYGTQFALNFEIGKGRVGFPLHFYLSDVKTIETGIIFKYDFQIRKDIPFFLTPNFMVGPAFSFSEFDKLIAIDIDIGLQLKYAFMSNMAATFTPINFIINPFQYVIPDVGESTTETDVYVFWPLLFGVEYRF